MDIGTTRKRTIDIPVPVIQPAWNPPIKAPVIVPEKIPVTVTR